MPTQIHRGDAVIVQQVSHLTPVVVNNNTYGAKINGKNSALYTADASATATEIVEGVKAILAAIVAGVGMSEFLDAVYTENDAVVLCTGLATGKPFTILSGNGTGTLTPSTPTAAKSPSHWIAENFNGLTLPATGEDIYIAGNAISIKWGLAQSGVTLASLHFAADWTGECGLPEINKDTNEFYYEYLDTHLAISATALYIGEGVGNGSRRIKLNTGSNVCAATVYQTSNTPADLDEGAVHLVGSHASNSLHVFSGTVDIAMLPGYTAQWPTIVVAGGRVRTGTGVTLATVEVENNGVVETRSAVTTYRTRGNGRAEHYAGDITTADIQGGPLKMRTTVATTIGTLNGYDGKSLDLTDSDSNVTVTNMTIYANPANPFVILDPNNRLVMTNAASTPNGAQSLKVVTGSGRNVRIT